MYILRQPGSFWLTFLLRPVAGLSANDFFERRQGGERWSKQKKNKKQKLRRSFVLTPTQIEIDQ